MIQVAVIADDLTGANATGVQISKNGLKVFTSMTNDPESIKKIEGYDCLITETNSRVIDAQLAKEKVLDVGNAILQHQGIKVFSKRIDSTLRGNLGSETDAFLEVLGDDFTAIVVPVFPSSGRITVGGRLLVDQIPLHKTAVALDPLTPIHTSDVARLIGFQTQHQVASIYIEELNHGTTFLAEKILALKEEGARIIVIDAITENDIDIIAKAVIETKIKFLAVDPGVFTSFICKHMVDVAEKEKAMDRKILVAVGSVNPVAAKQVQKFLSIRKSNTVFMEVHRFLEGEKSRLAEIDRVVAEINKNVNHFDVSSVIGSGIYPENRIDLKKQAAAHGISIDDISGIINRSIAQIVRKILDSNTTFKGLYTSGGDVSISVCEQVKAIGLELIDEVVPLASYGILQGGDHENLKLITKGGMVGDEDAILTCVNYLKGEIL